MAELGALIVGVISAVTGLIMALRKRKDVDVEELQERVAACEKRNDDFETEVERLREDLIECERQAFRLRRVITANGLEDPIGGVHDH